MLYPSQNPSQHCLRARISHSINSRINRSQEKIFALI
ncbi:hypothetical protein [Staphylococcus phage PT1-4]